MYVCICHCNKRFTYLLTYLLTYKHFLSYESFLCTMFFSSRRPNFKCHMCQYGPKSTTQKRKLFYTLASMLNTTNTQFVSIIQRWDMHFCHVARHSFHFLSEINHISCSNTIVITITISHCFQFQDRFLTSYTQTKSVRFLQSLSIH